MKKHRLSRALCALLAAAALGAGVAGCVPLVIGGAAFGGLMVADRRTTGTQVEDEGIELRAINRITAEYGERVHINVTSYNRQVLITGEVPTAEVGKAIHALVADVGNVTSVINDVAVMPPSSLAQRSSDTFITGKVRARLVDAKDISAIAFKVVTEREATRATSIASGVDGVHKVVRTFQVLTEEQLMRIISPPLAPVTTDAPLATSNAQANTNATPVQVTAPAAPAPAAQAMPVQMQSLPPLAPLN